MNRSRTWLAGLALACALVVPASRGVAAEEPADPPAPAHAPTAEDYSYYRPVTDRTPAPTLAQQKAAVRAEQRMARLAAMRWYGFYGSRPTASGLPWTTMYSPAWQMPGGRPFAWYTSSRPVVIYSPAPVAAYR